MNRFSFLVAGFAIVLAGCGPMTRADKVAALPGKSDSGLKIWTAKCVSCHGADGKGTTAAKGIIEDIKEDTKAKLASTIINGVPNTTMVSFDAALLDQELADLLEYMKNTLAK